MSLILFVTIEERDLIKYDDITLNSITITKQDIAEILGA